ncbi:MAG: protein kinase, partial [Eubacterium sp.]|nr:protein kinase [Eubacterium sp.]
MQEGSAAGNKYKIIKTIGSGGMSVVYLAEDMVLQCVWAVKVVRKGVTAQEKWKEKQILSEAMLLKRLNHPGFPRIVDLYHEEACTCIVMDYIEGRTLEELLQEKGPGSEKEVISRARQLCDMLSYLHKMEPPV